VALVVAVVAGSVLPHKHHALRQPVDASGLTVPVPASFHLLGSSGCAHAEGTVCTIESSTFTTKLSAADAAAALRSALTQAGGSASLAVRDGLAYTFRATRVSGGITISYVVSVVQEAGTQVRVLTSGARG
jgi:hypothetical protein